MTHLVASTLGVHKHKQGFHERRRDRFYHKGTTFVFLLKEESSTPETYIQEWQSSKQRKWETISTTPTLAKKKKTPKNKKNTYYFTGLTLNKTLHIKLRTKYLQATICPWESSHAFGFTLYTLSILEMLAFVFIFIIFGITFPQTSANALTVKQQEVTFLKI